MDLQDIRIVTLEKPEGWYTFDVSAEPSDDADPAYEAQNREAMENLAIPTRKPVHAHILQIIVIANHMNGKDTHVRGLKVLGPLE